MSEIGFGVCMRAFLSDVVRCRAKESGISVKNCIGNKS